ncbi:MAG TPA: hypothetical protein VEQ16_02650 [Acidocella sp.]|jgi:hypothetical protein|nr:hypothetical protein [Acidocella sp.]
MSYFSAVMVVLGIELLALLALLGERHFAMYDRIPVRWSKAGGPSLYITRRVGLTFFPVVGTLLLLLLALAHQPVYILAITQLGLAAANILYFRAVGRTMEET